MDQSACRRVPINLLAGDYYPEQKMGEVLRTEPGLAVSLHQWHHLDLPGSFLLRSTVMQNPLLSGLVKEQET